MTYTLTTPLYYVNASPHLGSTYTTIACDALARFQRLERQQVLFITGVLKAQKKVDYMTYECPVYFRFDPRKRGMTAAQPNFMFAPELKTNEHPSKWILRGVALLTYPGE